MPDADQLQRDIHEFRLHFDQVYLDGIPRLLDEKGMFLAFLLFLTAVDVLAGVYSCDQTNGTRFKSFAGRFLPEYLRSYSDGLWKARNLMVHSFNPSSLVSLAVSRIYICPNPTELRC